MLLMLRGSGNHSLSPPSWKNGQPFLFTWIRVFKWWIRWNHLFLKIGQVILETLSRGNITLLLIQNDMLRNGGKGRVNAIIYMCIKSQRNLTCFIWCYLNISCPTMPVLLLNKKHMTLFRFHKFHDIVWDQVYKL